MDEGTLLNSMEIPARTDAAGRYEERQTAIARWCKPTLPKTKRVSTAPTLPGDSEATSNPV